MKTKFNLGEEVYVKDFSLVDEDNKFTVDSITIDKYGTSYFLRNKDSGIVKIYEEDLESVVQQ